MSNSIKSRAYLFVLFLIVFVNYALAEDANGNGINDGYEHQFAVRFAPILHYHCNNPLFPLAVNEIYGEEDFVNNDNGYVPLPIDEHSPNAWKNYFENNLVNRGIVPTVYYNIITQELDVGQNYTIIQYWFYYPFNDASNLHEGDWEHVAVITEGIDPNVANPVGAVYHHHYVLDRYSWESLEKSGDHIHCYVGGKTRFNIKYISILVSLTRSDDCPSLGGYEEITGASFPHSKTYYEIPYKELGIPQGVAGLIDVDEFIEPNRTINFSDYLLVNLRDDNNQYLWWKNYNVYFGTSKLGIVPTCEKNLDLEVFNYDGEYAAENNVVEINLDWM